MKRIDTSTAVPNKNGAGKTGFQNGNLATGQQATAFNADWANNVQEEIANAIEGADIPLDGGVQFQLLAAIKKLVNSRFSGENRSLAASGFQLLPGLDGQPRLLMQWGSASSGTDGVCNLTFPIAFPAGALIVIGNHSGGDSAVVTEVGGLRTPTGTRLLVKNLVGATDAWSISWFALGA